MKIRFETHHALAEKWAERSQEYGRATNMFFEGDCLYSWGKHYMLARFTEHKDRVCVLFNSKDYSVSTDQHHRVAGSVVDFNKYEYFIVPSLSDGNGPDHGANRAYFSDGANSAATAAMRARRFTPLHLNRAITIEDTARRYSKFFGLEWKRGTVITVSECGVMWKMVPAKNDTGAGTLWGLWRKGEYRGVICFDRGIQYTARLWKGGRTLIFSSLIAAQAALILLT